MDFTRGLFSVGTIVGLSYFIVTEYNPLFYGGMVLSVLLLIGYGYMQENRNTI